MKKIKEQNVEEEIKTLKGFLENVTYIRDKEKNYLKKRGYELIELGTGKTVKTYSKEVKVMCPYRSYELPKLLTVGIANRGCGKYSIYRAYAKQITA